MPRTWETGNLTVKHHPNADDSAICEVCGKVGQVGREVFISWGMAVIGAVCRDCRKGETT